MRIQIVIPVSNLWSQYTVPCVASIRTSFDHRVLVIDNASSDETNREARARVSPAFGYHRNGANLGVARAWNDGIRDAFERGYDLVVVLNNDVVLHAECIDRLAASLCSAKNYALVSAVDVREEFTSPELMLRSDPRAREGIEDSDSPNFAAFVMNRNCWETVGPFDENFFPAYFEDNDYHLRITLAGLRAVCHPAAMFYHFGSRTQFQARDRPLVPRARFEQNQYYYFRKWGGLPGQERFAKPFNGQSPLGRNS